MHEDGNRGILACRSKCGHETKRRNAELRRSPLYIAVFRHPAQGPSEQGNVRVVLRGPGQEESSGFAGFFESSDQLDRVSSRSASVIVMRQALQRLAEDFA